MVKELLPFGFQNVNEFSVLSHKLANNGRNFLKLILSIYDHSVMMHVMFPEDVIRCREVIVL